MAQRDRLEKLVARVERDMAQSGQGGDMRRYEAMEELRCRLLDRLLMLDMVTLNATYASFRAR